MPSTAGFLCHGGRSAAHYPWVTAAPAAVPLAVLLTLPQWMVAGFFFHQSLLTSGVTPHSVTRGY